MSFQLDTFTNKLKRKGSLLLIVMDGVGIGKKDKGDCVYNAQTPFLDEIKEWSKKHNLYTELLAHGTYVGLPTDKDIGNSEVGHNAMGAGRVFFQGAELVNQSIESKKIFESKTFKDLIDIPNSNCLHLIGLLSDGNVHSHINHLFALLDYLSEKQFPNVCIHTLLDGRDVPDQSALVYINQLELKLTKLNSTGKNNYKIASGGGRMHVTMDRYESDWGVVERGWNAHVRGIPDSYENYLGYFKTAEEAIKTARSIDEDISDQYLPSFVIIDDNNKPVGKIKNGDSVIFFNFRGDRALQISKAFENKNFDKFDRIEYPRVKYAGMLEYDHEEKIPKKYLVDPPEIENTVSEFIAYQHLSQYACAETHKFGHMTYFWNGNRTGYINKQYEVYEEIKSEPTEMIIKNPGMQALKVSKATSNALDMKNFDFLRVNFANGDMAGHTGKIDVTIKSVEVMDEAIGLLKQKIDELKGIMIITADHGNAEEMIDEKGAVKTAHTTNLVPFMIYDPDYNDEYQLKNLEKPQLGNLASTILFFLGFHPPNFYLPSLTSFSDNNH
ncbi:MAG: 2,3-bisphosphoglycerate-independent phosphoglycerate mutase [Candidatus Thorarchaeota archaeon]